MFLETPARSTGASCFAQGPTITGAFDDSERSRLRPNPFDYADGPEALGETVSARKTSITWFRRTASSSSKCPTRASTLVFGTVVILSTIRRQDTCRPLRSFGSTSRRKSGASVSSLVKGHTVMELVPSKLSSWTMATGRGLPAYSCRRRQSRSHPTPPHSFISPRSGFHSEIASMNA